MTKSHSQQRPWHLAIATFTMVAALTSASRTASAQMLGNILAGSNGSNPTAVTVSETVGVATNKTDTIGPDFVTTVGLGVAALDSLTATLNPAAAPGTLSISQAGATGVVGTFSTDKMFTGVNLTVNTPYQFTLTKSAATQIGLLGNLSLQVSVAGVSVDQSNLLSLFTAGGGNVITVNFTTPATLNPAGPLEINLSGTTTAGLLGGSETFTSATFNQVPEPGTWACLALGLCLLVVAQRFYRPRGALPALLLPASVALCFVALGESSALRAAPASNAVGARLLRAELPAKMMIPQADCETLARAVRRATLAHHGDTAAILSAALAGNVNHERPCACVQRLFHASATAAPDETSALLEVASALFPDCADALGAGLNESDTDDVSISSAGFGVGFGPGFPGSPGFTGSALGGGLALPPVAVTAVVNG